MSNQRLPKVLTFYRSGPMPCPYIPGRTEQQLFTDLSERGGQDAYQLLSQSGFRRSHHIAYRPACPGCTACIPVRVPVDRFDMTRSWRRVLRANARLTIRDGGRCVSDEQFALFQRYIVSRHGDGEMARMTRRDFGEMIASSPVETTVFEFREPDGKLAAACLTDRLRDGYSAVYSFFDPDQDGRSLGSYVILTLIEEARRLALPHVYLGFYIGMSRKMTYKRRFRPLEAYLDGTWQELEPCCV